MVVGSNSGSWSPQNPNWTLRGFTTLCGVEVEVGESDTSALEDMGEWGPRRGARGAGRGLSFPLSFPVTPPVSLPPAGRDGGKGALP